MILLDTNVLVYAINSAAPQHTDSRSMLRSCADGRVPGVVVPQVLLEFYATVTSGRRVPNPLTPQQARAEIDGLCRRLDVRPVPHDSLSGVLGALAASPRVGHGIFDLYLIAQMRSLRIADVCTYNVGDFAVPGIRALPPSDALAAYGEG